MPKPPGAPRSVAWITGASAGIGEAFARALAARSHDLVLIARRRERLDALAKELSEAHGITASVEPADLTSAEARAPLALALADAPPDVLVNNAGFGTAGRLAELPAEGELAEVRLNVEALVDLTRAALPGMIARGSGAIVNVSSLAGELPSPFNATYGATKAFVTSFTEAVHEELRGTGVKIQALLPGFTRTEFQEVAGVDAGRVPELAWMDAEQVVRASLASLGRGELRCVPGTTNKVLAAATALAPRAVLRRFAAAAQRGSFE